MRRESIINERWRATFCLPGPSLVIRRRFSFARFSHFSSHSRSFGRSRWLPRLPRPRRMACFALIKYAIFVVIVTLKPNRWNEKVDLVSGELTNKCTLCNFTCTRAHQSNLRFGASFFLCFPSLQQYFSSPHSRVVATRDGCMTKFGPVMRQNGRDWPMHSEGTNHFFQCAIS